MTHYERLLPPNFDEVMVIVVVVALVESKPSTAAETHDDQVDDDVSKRASKPSDQSVCRSLELRQPVSRKRTIKYVFIFR